MGKTQRYRAVRTKVSGHKAIGLAEDEHVYDSKLEAKCAEILLRHGIKFKPHVKFNCIDTEGKPFEYTVDFLFYEPQKFKGIRDAVDAIEVKGFLTDRDFLRKKALWFKHDLRAYIALSGVIDYWGREGIKKNKRSD